MNNEFDKMDSAMGKVPGFPGLVVEFEEKRQYSVFEQSGSDNGFTIRPNF